MGTTKSKGDSYLKRLIEEGLNRTSVTAVLIGQGTAHRRWVNYEIVKSFERGNGIFGVHINRIRGKDGFIVSRGANPFDRLGFKVSEEGKKVNFYELKNPKWVEFDDLPQINNKKSNTLYFHDSFWFGNDYGEFHTFSQKFKTYCWDFNGGNKNFIHWVDDAAKEAGR